MQEAAGMAEEYLDPPPRLLERLRQIAGYTWDESQKAFHSSYDNWHIFGVKNTSSASTKELLGQIPKSASQETAVDGASRVPEATEKPSRRSSYGSDSSTTDDDNGHKSAGVNVIAKVSTHALREERAFHICRNLSKNADPQGRHIVRPVDFIRLPSQPGDKGPIIVSIFEAPGPNALLKYIDFGPAWYRGLKNRDEDIDHEASPSDHADTNTTSISIPLFLDFAIGACECLELLHHGQRIVHGEIRGDAFHLDEATGQTRLINFGSGLRTFEHGLTSTGWSSLSKEAGAKTKLCFISPEQTGRMPAEPDSRTDIYSLGILFWTLLTQQTAFEGDTPMDVLQSVLVRRLPSVSTVRLDVPDVISRIISKMSAKVITERYHSASGLKHDLLEVQKLLGNGDTAALKSFKIASKDVSSFFLLPNVLIGRADERNEIVQVIDKVSNRHILSQKQGVHSLSSGSSLESPIETTDLNDASSENTSSADKASLIVDILQTSPTSRSLKGSNSSIVQSVSSSQGNSFESQKSGKSVSSSSHIKPWEKNTSLALDVQSFGNNSHFSNESTRSSSEGVGSMTAGKNKEKFRRKGRCEVISIAGAAGLGKSSLVQSVQVEARRRGYFASSKFDQTKRTPFGPVLRLLSSLFKQVFSESNTDTQFHQLLKQYIRPSWPLLHRMLGLPEFLLGPERVYPKRQSSHQSSQSSGINKAYRTDGRRDSASIRGSMYSATLGAQSSQDFLRSGSLTKSTRLMNTFLDVLRVFAQHKFLCLCLDDIQFADDESLDLIAQLISARMKMVIIVTYRPNEILPDRVRSVIQPPDAEGYVKSAGVGILHLVLRPFSEDEVAQYVAATLSRPKEEIIPLAAIIHSKSGGNPFYMKEMLDASHRKGAIYYDYRRSCWEYDIDRVFTQFSSEHHHDILDDDFVTRRLSELPPTSRLVLAWASLIGTTFSFELLQRLLSGEFDYDENKSTKIDVMSTSPDDRRPLVQSQADTVAGLQAAIQAYIIVATESDDKFRFAHDRYIQAASSLRERETAKFHFVIACTLLKYYPSDEAMREMTAEHICEAIPVINQRVLLRRPFRQLLFEGAQSAAEDTARPTAAKYYNACFALLQDDPWSDGQSDAFYEESLALHIRAAECYHFMGNFDESMKLLDIVLEKGRTPVDKAPAWVLESRVHAQCGDSVSALGALESCLATLGIDIDRHPSFEKCDAEFERLATKLQSTLKEDLLAFPIISTDSTLSAIGTILVEAISTAFWSDRLKFYQMTLVMVDAFIRQGSFYQIPLALTHMASIAISRFGMVQFANELGLISLDLMDRYKDPYTLGRGGTIYSLFVGHIQFPLSVSFLQLEQALEYTIQAGDRIAIILNFGIVALLKFFGSESLSDLENFCQYGCEEVPNWQYDCRGGTMLIAVRQVCRALQGRTLTTNPEGVMTDESHDTSTYLAWVKTTLGPISDRPIFIYQSMQIAPLFLYGHYDKAVEIGQDCYEMVDAVWSARNTRFTFLFYGLALAGVIWRKIQDPRFVDSEEHRNQVESTVKTLLTLRKKIVEWQVVNDVNYLAWSKLLDAQISELQGATSVLQYYEDALDHAAANGFTFEEALGNFLLAGFFLRRGSRRPAKAALRETVMLYRQFGAIGVASQIEAEHSLLLQGPTRSSRSADVGVQTDFAGDSVPVQYQTLDGDENVERQQTRALMTETKGERIDAWQGNSSRAEAGSGLPALDMLDLTSILESSQVISSVLKVDQLLKTMCEIIISNCGGVASFAAIVVEEDDPQGWSIAASGDPENGATAHIPGLPLAENSMVAESVILYCTRFRETVFLPDLIQDERFSNVSEDWWLKNYRGKAVIAIPIAHGTKPLLGVLYLEGQPNAFTDRNLTVLQLLVNQIGISYSNALTLKAIEKVSASNISMVESQKRALAKAKAAEAKSRLAEAEALRNVKLAEEAAKAKSIFLANVSHELRTPLNGVIGNSELLKDSDLRKEQADMADSIRVSADLLLTVINDILDFSKMEADKMKLFIVAFNPDEMLREVVRSVSYSNRDKRSSKDVEIRQDINLPQTLIYGDPVRLHQVIGNLIGNSLKFTEKGSITVGARLDGETQDRVQLTFWVKDTGIGIPPSQLAKLFKPFSQADASTARKYGGSGLGLSICKSLVETMMGGRIQLDSEEGVGTTAWFTVTFPKANPEASAGDSQNGTDNSDPMAKYVENGDSETQASFAEFSHIPRDQLRICIAEDNPINQKIAIQFVQKLGFVYVDAYDNGLAAVEGLREKAKAGTPYHLVLMDVQMPVLDGYEATKLLRRDPIEAVRTVLVIAMTASAIQGDREKCLESGMNDYLAKPVRVHILKRKLEQYLQQRPLTLPNLQTETNKVAQEVMNRANRTSQPPAAAPPINNRPTPQRRESGLRQQNKTSDPSNIPYRTKTKADGSDGTDATDSVSTPTNESVRFEDGKAS